MERQDWQGNQLDKDLLVQGNKIYSPDTCIFVSLRVNNFIVESSSTTRGDYPLGVSAVGNRFEASCGSILEGRNKKLGRFDTPEEAHASWLKYKLEQAYILAAQQTDERVAKALIERYENYKLEIE